jgi:ribonucleoside-diphosphate reductase beta chain
MRADHLEQRIQRLDEHRGEGFESWFDDALARRTDRLAARPDDIEAFVEAVTIYHLLIEGTIAVSAQHFILSRLESEGTLAGFVEGFTNVSRDEHRHVAFGVRFLHDAAATGHADTVRRTVAELEPTIDDLILPRREQLDDDVELLGATIGKRRGLALRELRRRLDVIGV